MSSNTLSNRLVMIGGPLDGADTPTKSSFHAGALMFVRTLAEAEMVETPTWGKRFKRVTIRVHSYKLGEVIFEDMRVIYKFVYRGVEFDQEYDEDPDKAAENVDLTGPTFDDGWLDR